MVDTLTEWYDNIVTSVKNAIETVFVKKTELNNLLKKEKTKVVLISPKILQKNEDIDIKALPIEDNTVTVGKKVYFYEKQGSWLIYGSI